jgi:hypothetical protein
LPSIIIFLCGFTIYSCFISSFLCLYVGAILGRIVIKYCLSAHSYFTHGAVLMIFCILASSYVILSKEAALCRTALANVAPDPSAVLRSRTASNSFKCFTSVLIAVISSSLALYLLLIYFPI